MGNKICFVSRNFSFLAKISPGQNSKIHYNVFSFSKICSLENLFLLNNFEILVLFGFSTS